MSALDDLFEQIDEQPIPGGCDMCDAYQTLTPDPVHRGIFHLKIVHDDWCPVVRTAKPTPNLDELLGPQQPADYSDEPF